MQLGGVGWLFPKENFDLVLAISSRLYSLVKNTTAIPTESLGKYGVSFVRMNSTSCGCSGISINWQYLEKVHIIPHVILQTRRETSNTMLERSKCSRFDECFNHQYALP